MKNILQFTLFLVITVSSSYAQGVFRNRDGLLNWNGGSSAWILVSGSDTDTIPDADDNVTIVDHSSGGNQRIIITGNQACNNLTIDGDFNSSGGGFTQLRINDGNTLTVNGTFNMRSSLFAQAVTLNLIGTAAIDVTGAITFNDNGGDDMDIQMIGASTFTVRNTMQAVSFLDIVTSSGGATFNFLSSGTAQTIPFGTEYIYDEITCNNTNASGVTLGAAVTSSNVTGGINVQTGTLSNGGFAIDGNSGESFTVANGATFLLTGTSVLPTTFNHVIGSTSTIEFGGGSQTIGILNNSQDYGNLTISGTGTKSLSSGGNRNVTGVLTVSASTLALGTGSDGITLVSTASSTASLAAITGTITGTQLTVQRHISSAATWRFLSSPVTGQTIDDWDDDIFTSGFTGSDGDAGDPSFVSIHTYNETTTGLKEEGFEAPTDSSDALTPGKGFVVYIDQSGTSTISVTGAPNSGSVGVSVSYTNDSGADEDGWNLVGNPFASDIDFTVVKDDAAFVGLDSSYTTLDPSSGNYVTWNETTQSGAAGGNIAAGQAFWVHAVAAPTLSIPQAAKTTASTNEYFKQGDENLDIKLSSNINSFYDVAIVRGDERATNSYDRIYDDVKFFTQNPLEVPSLSVLSSDDMDLAVSSVANLVGGDSVLIPLRVKVGISGTYKLAIDGFDNFSMDASIVLEDLLTGTYTSPVGDSLFYSFSIEDTTESPRFILHVVSNLPGSVGITENIYEEKLNVYPNPFNDETTFLFPERNENDVTFILIDQLGHVVNQSTIQQGSSRFVLNRRGLSNGIYFYRIVSEDSTTVFDGKVVIQ